MSKRPGSLVLTFSKKNIDIRKLLETQKETSEAFIVTDYICEAIRFYEKYKKSTEFSDLNTVRKLIDERLKQFMTTNSTVTLGLVEPDEMIKDNPITNSVKTNINTLEMDLDDISTDED